MRKAAEKGETVFEVPQVQEAQQRLDSIRGELAAAHKRLNELGAKTQEDGDGRRANLERLAEAVLAGEPVATVDPAALEGEVRQLATQIRVLTVAEQRGRARLDLAVEDATRRRLGEEQGRYRELAEEIGAASERLAAAAAAFREWRDELEAQGYAFGTVFEPPPSAVLGWRMEGQTFGRLDMVRDWVARAIDKRRAAA